MFTYNTLKLERYRDFPVIVSIQSETDNGIGRTSVNEKHVLMILIILVIEERREMIEDLLVNSDTSRISTVFIVCIYKFNNSVSYPARLN